MRRSEPTTKSSARREPSPRASDARAVTVSPPSYGLGFIDGSPNRFAAERSSAASSTRGCEHEAERFADLVARGLAAPRPDGEGTPADDGESPVAARHPPCWTRASVPAVVRDVLASPGTALDSTTRRFMESRLGHDLSRVRVHTGTLAAQSARAVNARAYTVAPSIVFGAGEYRPHTGAGRRLLAHELAHVAQQESSGVQRLDRFEARVHESAERYGLTTSAGAGRMTNEEASAVYFGNWMRDMNQVFVPMLTGLWSPDVLFALISYLAARKFGRELTPEQFGYYVPAEHIDNPGGLVAADDLLPSQPPISGAARPQAPERLGAPRPSALDTPQDDVSPSGTVERVNIFAVDQTGVMAFIRRTNLHIERRLRLAVTVGRNPDGMHHFGAALHSLEDLFAHSNFVEIAVDRLLRSDPAFLQQLAGQQRQLFTYSPRVAVGPEGEVRPVLTTGTFTGADTHISIASEVVGVLSRPLPEPTTNAQRHAQERFVLTLLRTFETRLRTNPELRQAVREAARQVVPDWAASRVDQVPIAAIYETGTLLGIPLPDFIMIPLRRRIRDVVSREVLQSAAGHAQAAGLEARVADTNLIRVLRESRRQEQGQFTEREREQMRQTTRFTGQSAAAQEAQLRAAGARRMQAVRTTPLAVIAGPSHSQIAKDHPNSPFFGLAFRLAAVAIHRLRDKMLAAWAERVGAPTTAFNFEWASFPQAAPAGSRPAVVDAHRQGRALYHVGRPDRGRAERESLQQGRDIAVQGGAPGQSYDLAAMRVQSAERVRSVARALQAMASAPGSSQTALVQFRSVLGQLAPEVEQRFRAQLTRAAAAAGAASASQTVAQLTTVANDLLVVAASIETARVHADREVTNARLVTKRLAMLEALARNPGGEARMAVALLYVLDEEIQATAVTYTTEQRAVLEGRRQVPEIPNPVRLSVAHLTLPAVVGSTALTNLLNEARLLVNHPYADNWWEAHVRDYAQRFPDRLINDIEARNEGVPFFRR